MTDKKRHFQNLEALLGIKGEMLELCYEHLRRIEEEGHRLAERHCNGELSEEQFAEAEQRLKKNTLATLAYARQEVVRNIHFNWDPRGYFLKIDDDYVRKNKVAIETDWGGYGILVPQGI